MEKQRSPSAFFIMLLLLLSNYSSLSHGAPWSNRYTGQVLLGSGQFAGFVDSMLPLGGNERQLFFADGTVVGGSGANLLASPGLGARQIYRVGEKNVILGAFVFADYQRSNLTQAWIANPGIEILTKHQELRVSGYLPISNRSQAYRNTLASNISNATLSDSGRTNTDLYFTNGHTLFDTPVELTNEYGRGLEAEVGQYIPFHKGGWIRAGIYHFTYSHAKYITGVEANLEVFTTKFASIIIQNNYDNQNKNKIALGIRLNWGGPDHTEVDTLSNRMEEPIIRHQARQSYGLATPIRSSFASTGPTEATTRDIWFFSTMGTNQQGTFSLANCTAENPCLNFDQDIVNNISGVTPDASFWFAPGTYSLPTTGTNGFVQLFNGQTLAGRTASYQQAASSFERPLIEGGLWWDGNGAIYDMQVVNHDQQIPISPSTVISVGARGNLLAERMTLVATSTGGASASAVYTIGSSTINNVSATVTGAIGGLGVYAEQDSLINNTTINTTGNVFSYAVTARNATILNSILNADGAESTGVFSYGGNIEISDSTVNSVGINNTAGLYALTGNVLINNSTISTTSTGTGYALGVFAQGNITFEGIGASHVAVSANLPGIATPLFPFGTFSNNSTPKSQCSTNGGPESDCV